MNRRFFAEFLTLLSVQQVDKDELGSDECLIGDVLVKFKVLNIRIVQLYFLYTDLYNMAIASILNILKLMTSKFKTGYSRRWVVYSQTRASKASHRWRPNNV